MVFSASGDVAYHTKLGDVTVRSIQYVPEEKRVFAGFDNGELVAVDLVSGDVSHRSRLGFSHICKLEYVPEEKRLRVGARRGGLCLGRRGVPPETRGWRKQPPVLFALPGNGGLVAVDLASGDVAHFRKFVDLGDLPPVCEGVPESCLRYVPEAKLLFAGLLDGKLLAVDPTSGNVVHSADLGISQRCMLQYVPGEKRLFAVVNNGKLFAVDPASGDVTLHAELHSLNIQGFQYVPGEKFVFAGFWCGQLVAVHLASGDVTRRGRFQELLCLFYVPEVKWLFASLGVGDLIAVDPASGDKVRHAKLRDSGIQSLQYVSEVNQFFVALSDGDLVAVDPASFDVVRVVTLGNSFITNLQYVPEAKQRFVGFPDGELLGEPINVSMCSMLPNVLRDDASLLPGKGAIFALPFICGGASPLHAADVLDKPEFAQTLLEAGSNLWLHDADGETAMQRALTAHSYRTLAVLVRAAGANPGTLTGSLNSETWTDVVA